jgi:hypothetical protein
MKNKKKTMSPAKKRKLENWVKYHASKKDKGRAKAPATTKKCGRVFKVKL